jgi:hypothetical protein
MQTDYCRTSSITHENANNLHVPSRILTYDHNADKAYECKLLFSIAACICEPAAKSLRHSWAATMLGSARLGRNTSQLLTSIWQLHRIADGVCC